MAIQGFAELQALAEIAPGYLQMRREHPLIPARKIHEYLRSGVENGESFEVFMCPGHQWIYTGSAYGGDDDRWCGEGRCYCRNCGADGDG